MGVENNKDKKNEALEYDMGDQMLSREVLGQAATPRSDKPNNAKRPYLSIHALSHTVSASTLLHWTLPP